jgi:polyphosphate kinase
MTTDLLIIKELMQLFKFLQRDDKTLEKARLKFEKLLVSQFNMNERFEKLIEDEIAKAALGQPAEIRIKVNNLEEPHMINMLYKASQAGVKVKLIVRSICCIMPGIQGISDNVVVRRIIDRYLEHTRLFIFGAGPDAETIMGSADWMTRNLHHRIEVCVSMKNITCKRELIDYFEMQWHDTDKAVELSPNLEQNPVTAENGKKFNAQYSIYQSLQNRV